VKRICFYFEEWMDFFIFIFMKIISIVLLTFLIAPAYSQKIALLDIKFSQPIIYTDSVTVEQTTKYFPVNVNDFDSLYADLNFIKNILQKRQRSKMKSFELHAGNSSITIKRVPFAYGDRYKTILNTHLNEIETKYDLAPLDMSNAKNARHIEKIMAYMKSNKDLFKQPYEVQPKIYNIITVTE